MQHCGAPFVILSGVPTADLPCRPERRPKVGLPRRPGRSAKGRFTLSPERKQKVDLLCRSGQSAKGRAPFVILSGALKVGLPCHPERSAEGAESKDLRRQRSSTVRGLPDSSLAQFDGKLISRLSCVQLSRLRYSYKFYPWHTAQQEKKWRRLEGRWSEWRTRAAR